VSVHYKCNHHEASSLVRRQVCLLLIVLSLSVVIILKIKLFTTCTICNIHNIYNMYMGQCQSRPARADHAICSTLFYNDSLVTWMVVNLTITKFKPLILSAHGFILSYDANTCTCMIWKTSARCLHNCVIKSYMYTMMKITFSSWVTVCLGKLPLCGVPCFAGSAVLKDRCLLWTPTRGRHKSLLTKQVLYGGLIYGWCLTAYFWKKGRHE